MTSGKPLSIALYLALVLGFGSALLLHFTPADELFTPLAMVEFLLSLKFFELFIMLPFALFFFALPAALVLQNSTKIFPEYVVDSYVTYLGLSVVSLGALLTAPTVVFALQGIFGMGFSASLVLAITFSWSCFLQGFVVLFLAGLAET